MNPWARRAGATCFFSVLASMPRASQRGFQSQSHQCAALTCASSFSAPAENGGAEFCGCEASRDSAAPFSVETLSWARSLQPTSQVRAALVFLAFLLSGWPFVSNEVWARTPQKAKGSAA